MTEIGANVRFPFGDADVQSPAYAATIAATIKNGLTIIDPATLTGATTLNLTIDEDLPIGAELRLELTADGSSRTFTFGTGITGNNLSVTANKTFAVSAYYNGTAFIIYSTLVTD